MSIHLPAMSGIKTGRSGVVAFAGLNRNLRQEENEFTAMENMTGAELPVAASRKKRRFIRKLQKPNGLFAHDKLCWVDGTAFCYNGVEKGTLTDSKKTFVRMGSRVVIFPDKKMYDSTEDALISLEASYTSTGAVTATLCRADGTDYASYTVGAAAPENPTDGQLWMDESGETAVLRQYSASSSMWTSIPTVYTRIAASGIGQGFAQYDGVTISGMETAGLNGEFFLVSCGENAVVVTALITAAVSQTAAMTMERKCPDIDYVTECDNRLWGCAAEGNEIFSCALGDPTNWRQYMGLATDSYAVNVGSGGAFTGAATHLGSVLFFKTDCIHQIMGTKPANYTLSSLQTRGVGVRCAGSLCRVNETLYFKAPEDVCSYASALPYSISAEMPGTGGNAVAGAVQGRYYLCVDAGPERISSDDVTQERELLVYDTKNGCWVREDGLDVRWFATLDGKLYMLTGDGALWCAADGANEYDGPEAMDEGRVAFALETGDIGQDEPYSKYISHIQLNGDADLGTTLRVAVRYDGKGGWQEVYRCAPVTRRGMVIPIRPRRCHSLRLRIQGIGGMRLYSIIRQTEAGSDIYR